MLTEKECEGCYFFEEDPFKPFCKRMDNKLRDFGECDLGKLVQIPKEITPLNLSERILLYTWAGEDISKAKALSRLDGMDEYPDSYLKDHYRRTAETYYRLRKYLL